MLISSCKSGYNENYLSLTSLRIPLKFEQFQGAAFDAVGWQTDLDRVHVIA